MTRLMHLVGVAVFTAAIASGCSGPPATDAAADRDHGPSSGPTTSAPTPEGLTDVSPPVRAGDDIHGLVEAHGHRLTVHCVVEGQPTVVILHGWIDQPGITSLQQIDNCAMYKWAYERRDLAYV